MPFLCPHVICQTVINHVSGSVRLFPASLCQALPASLQSTTGRSVQPHSNPQLAAQPSLTQDHSPSFLSHLPCHSPSRSMSLSLAINLSIQLLMQLSHRMAHSAYCPYCPSQPLAFSFPLQGALLPSLIHSAYASLLLM